MNRAALESLSREQLIEIGLAQAEVIAQLTKRVEELEAKLGLPPKGPENSSVPPSQGRKASGGAAAPVGKGRRKLRRGSHRSLDPDPTRTLEIRASCCPHCRGDVSGAPQTPCEAYDHLDIPPVRPDVTRVALHGGACPHCAGRDPRPPRPPTCRPARRSGRTCAPW